MSHATPYQPPAGTLGRIETAVTSTEQIIASVALVVALVVALYTVLMRAIHVPTGEWVLDLPIELLGVTAIYGAGAMLGRRAHMSVGFVVARFPPRPAHLVALFTHGLMLVICVVLTSRAFIAAGQAARAGLRQHELFDVPVSWLVYIGAVGFVGWTLHSGFALLHLLLASRGMGERPLTAHQSVR